MTGEYVNGGGALARCGPLRCFQVRVNPCRTRGRADRSLGALWNRRESVSLLSHGEASHPSPVSTLLCCRRVNEPQVYI